MTVLADFQRQLVGLGDALDRLQHAPVARGWSLPGGPAAGSGYRPATAHPDDRRYPRHPDACSTAGGRRLPERARNDASPPGTSRFAACSSRHGSTRRPPRPSTRRPYSHRSRRTPPPRDRVGRPARRSGNADQLRGSLLRRQASEQYFTSAQFFHQRRRQVITRPQPTQGLLGNAALFPRKSALRRITVEPRGGRSGRPFFHPGAAPAPPPPDWLPYSSPLPRPSRSPGAPVKALASR